MNQLSLIPMVDNALEAAKLFIRPYVRRGDDISYLKDMGAYSTYRVTIGGYMNGIKVGNHQIGVERDIEGKEVNKIFKLKDVYEEVKGE